MGYGGGRGTKSAFDGCGVKDCCAVSTNVIDESHVKMDITANGFEQNPE